MAKSKDENTEVKSSKDILEAYLKANKDDHYNFEDSIYYKDEYGNEYWHGKLIPKNEATIEEQEELKKLLSDIYEEE